MATITLHDGILAVRFTRFEKLAGLVRDLAVPVSSIVAARVEPDGLRAVRGLRAPGLGLPFVRKIGTWRSRAGSSLVSVRRGQPALVLNLTGAKYRQVVVGLDDPASYVDRLQV
ncbi:hypothetical protein [Nocardioides sp. LS1]|uniref:hypothetical protein n=1 Tax=Nocardioides sp. LS1 TaxID=1027620 RepID=UPI000F61E6CF|nr:hypothetical protein [Nocardioides sp. LS1]GCD90959.1 hypothetical protein NLS1_29650 [Nocardioides sp. LS1]